MVAQDLTRHWAVGPANYILHIYIYTYTYVYIYIYIHIAANQKVGWYKGVRCDFYLGPKYDLISNSHNSSPLALEIKMFLSIFCFVEAKRFRHT